MVRSNAFAHVFLFVVLFSGASCAQKCEEAVMTCIRALENGKECPLLPVLPQSLAPPVPDTGFLLKKVRPGVWSFFEGSYMALIAVTGSRLAVIDFPAASTKLQDAVLVALGGVSPKRIDMVYSHRHTDHIGGGGRFYRFARQRFPKSKVLVWGTKGTRAFLRERRPAEPRPNIIVHPWGRTVDLSPSLKIKLRIFGGHTADDLVAFIPRGRNGEASVAHLVDVMTTGFAPFDSFGLTLDVQRYLDVHDKLLRLNFDIYSPGHGKLATQAELRANKQYTLDTIKFAQVASASITNEDIAALGIPLAGTPGTLQFGNTQWAFYSRINLITERCFKDLVRKWGCKLSSVDVFGRTHCHAAFFLGFIDS